MTKYDLAKQFIFDPDWVLDPPDPLIKQFEIKDLAQLAIVQLRAQHTILKAQEEVIEEALKIYSGYLK